jgi:hypothetical protein
MAAATQATVFNRGEETINVGGVEFLPGTNLIRRDMLEMLADLGLLRDKRLLFGFDLQHDYGRGPATVIFTLAGSGTAS